MGSFCNNCQDVIILVFRVKDLVFKSFVICEVDTGGYSLFPSEIVQSSNILN